MPELTIALRIVHFATAISLAGGFAFLLLIGGPALRHGRRSPAVWLELEDRLARAGAWCLALLVASGILWFLMQAAAMRCNASADK